MSWNASNTGEKNVAFKILVCHRKLHHSGSVLELLTKTCICKIIIIIIINI